MNTIQDTKGIAWRKALEGKQIVDADEYNLIIDCCMESCLLQEGNLHLKLGETVFGQETEEGKQRIMQKCASLFGNEEKGHQVNLEVAHNLKDLANIIREPEVFSKIAQAAMQLLVACYMRRIDTFIKQGQVTLDAKQEKVSKCKSIDELMEMSNLPQYNIAWGDKNNKEKAATQNMVTIVWYFLIWEMCGTAPNIGNMADYFKVSRSQLSHLITAKSSRAGLVAMSQRREEWWQKANHWELQPRQKPRIKKRRTWRDISQIEENENLSMKIVSCKICSQVELFGHFNWTTDLLFRIDCMHFIFHVKFAVR